MVNQKGIDNLRDPGIDWGWGVGAMLQPDVKEKRCGMELARS